MSQIIHTPCHCPICEGKEKSLRDLREDRDILLARIEELEEEE